MSNEEEEEEEEQEENKNEAKFKKRGISPREQKRQGSKVMKMKTGEKKEDKMKVFTKERRDNKEVNCFTTEDPVEHIMVVRWVAVIPP